MQLPTLDTGGRSATRQKRYKPDALLYVTAAFMWVSIWRVQDLWPIIGKLQVPIVLELLLVATLFTSLRGPRNLKWTKSRIFALPFLLLIVMIAGLPMGLWPGRSFVFVTKGFLPSLLLLSAIALGVRAIEDLNWLAFTHVVGAAIYSFWTFLFVSVASDGRLIGSAHYDANDLALLLTATIPFAIYFLRPGVAGWKRLFSLFALILFIELTLKCGSRGGFIAFVVVLVYIVVAFRAIPARVRISAVAAAVLFMTVFASASYWNMMQTILHPKDDYNMTSPIGRKAIWKRGVGYMLQRPVLGVGVDDFEQAEGSLSAISQQYLAEHKGLKWSTAHNSFVLVGAETGFIGLVLFVTMLGTSFKHLLRIKKEPDGDPYTTDEDAAFAQTLTASLIGFCIAGFFVSAAYFSFLYALIGLIIATDSLRRRRQAAGVRQVGAVAPKKLQQRAQVRVPRGHWAPAG